MDDGHLRKNKKKKRKKTLGSGTRFWKLKNNKKIHKKIATIAKNVKVCSRFSPLVFRISPNLAK
jgi:ribosome assembly protein YihI (activator of Der GTPase)